MTWPPGSAETHDFIRRFLSCSKSGPDACSALSSSPSKTEFQVKQAEAQVWARWAFPSSSSSTQTNCHAHSKWECFLAAARN